MGHHVGIVGLGTYLPPEVRTNAWWAPEVVEGWAAKRRELASLPPIVDPTPGMRRVMELMGKQAADPFQGMVQRHVMPSEMESVDMEAEAARRAIAHAGIEPGEIDLVLTHTPVPEFLLSNTACVLHDRLSLSSDCITMQVDASGNSFLMQLAVAEQFIASGRASHALLVQSSAGSRLLEPDEVQSPLFGDGAAAVVIGRVPERSLFAMHHRTDSKHPRALIASVRGKRWYDEGPIVLHRGDLASSRQTFLESADRAREVIEPVLDKAGVAGGDVDLFAVHQGTPWLRQVTMEAAGITRAKHVDLFTHTGYLFGASIPFVLEAAHRDRLIADGRLVLALGGGVGYTFSAALLRWKELRR